MATLPRLVNACFPNFVDVQGGQANCMWTSGDQGDGGMGPYGGLIGATQSLTCASVFATVQQVRSLSPGEAETGPYCTVSDQVVFFVQSEGTSGQLVVPAPIESIFEAGGTNVDLTNGSVMSWWSAVQGVLGDSYGNPWNQLKYGRRRKLRITRT